MAIELLQNSPVNLERQEAAKEQHYKPENGLILPCGYRFAPNNHHLLIFYLLPKIFGRHLPCNAIRELDLYNYDPNQLPINESNHFLPNEAYFFTTTERKYTKGYLAKRTTTGGYWKGTGADKAIFYKNILVGHKKTMVFYRGKAPAGQKSAWVMHEFKLNPSIIPDVQQNKSLKAKVESNVVCRIRLKNGNNMTARIQERKTYSQRQSPSQYIDS